MKHHAIATDERLAKEDMMFRTRKSLGIAAAVVAVAIVGGVVGIAVAAGAGTDDEEPAITGAALDKASAAALAHTGGGTVTETEAGDEESMYEVEVTLDDGSEVDVQLDDAFNVVGDERDDADDEDEATERD